MAGQREVISLSLTPRNPRVERLKELLAAQHIPKGRLSEQMIDWLVDHLEGKALETAHNGAETGENDDDLLARLDDLDF
jgi:hypothetical protein